MIATELEALVPRHLFQAKDLGIQHHQSVLLRKRPGPDKPMEGLRLKDNCGKRCALGGLPISTVLFLLRGLGLKEAAINQH